jgi:hypothetical protein
VAYGQPAVRCQRRCREGARAERDRIWGLRGTKAHRGGLAAVRKSVAGKTTVVEQTRGHGQDSFGCRGSVWDVDARSAAGCAGGGWSEFVGGELMRRKESSGKSTRPRPLAGVFSSKEMLHEEGTTAMRLAGFEVDGEAGPVVVTASSASSRGEWSRERREGMFARR